jgi:hypothetical protein
MNVDNQAISRRRVGFEGSFGRREYVRHEAPGPQYSFDCLAHAWVVLDDNDSPDGSSSSSTLAKESVQ